MPPRIWMKTIKSLVQSVRYSSSASSKRWQTRQGKDKFNREAHLQGLKSRAAFKLLEINDKHRIFKPGQTIVDLGYAPGSWSQVAVDRARPGGRVIGIDLIPCQPPRGVSTIQGNFLDELIQQQVIDFVRDPDKGRLKEQRFLSSSSPKDLSKSDLERASTIVLAESAHEDESLPANTAGPTNKQAGIRADNRSGRVIDVVLSDMSAPWAQGFIYGKKSLSDPYFRMMNTSGNRFRDHAGSMDLCHAALDFCHETLRTGGSFICKFYQGSEDKAFENRLKALFTKVHREKPASSRSESKEAYFVGLWRKPDASPSDLSH